LAEDLATRDAHGGDAWFAAQRPDVVVFPRSAAEVGRILGFANRRRVPVTARGAGRGYVGGCVPQKAGIVLSLARLNQILEINVEDGVGIVQPGVITGKFQNEVERLGMFYPPDPASLDECFLGGNVATNAGGPRCVKYGVTRHYVLGLQVALADGSLVRVGGRTHKNKQGFDLVGIFVGSEGLLGVVTEITLRLLPLPPAQAVLIAGFASTREAAAAVQAIFRAGHLPCALEMADRLTLAAARRYLESGSIPSSQPTSGVAIPPGDSCLIVEVDGQLHGVREEARALASLLTEAGGLDVRLATDSADRREIWDLRRSFSYSLKATGLIKLNEDVTVPRSRLVELMSLAEELGVEHNIEVASFGHAGDGNIHVNLMIPPNDRQALARADHALDRLFKTVIEWGGVITGEHGIGLAKLPWWKMATSPELRRLHQKIKSALDPAAILNPDKFVGP
jgi:glycolate oxidase